MRFKALFDQGIEFKTYVAQGSEEEIQAVGKAAESVGHQLTPALASAISSVSQGVNILIAGETWCPDCQLNITAVSAMAQLQPNINISIISRDFAENNLLGQLDINQVKIPLMVILDQYYQPKGLFVEQPNTVKTSDDDTLKTAYNEGKCLNDTIIEVLDIIKA